MQDMLELHTPILIACNKSDLASARSEKFIVAQLLRAFLMFIIIYYCCYYYYYYNIYI